MHVWRSAIRRHNHPAGAGRGTAGNSYEFAFIRAFGVRASRNVSFPSKKERPPEGLRFRQNGRTETLTTERRRIVTLPRKYPGEFFRFAYPNHRGV